VFDLVTARLYPQNINLRNLWDDARESFPTIEDFGLDAYSILQSVALRSLGSAQRSDVVTKVSAENIDAHWQAVITGYAGVLDFLQSEHGVLSKKWLPYNMLLVPMAAIWTEIAEMKPLARAAALERLGRYFWTSTFMTNFDQGANSQAGADFARLKEWIHSSEALPPEAVQDFNLQESTIYAANVRRKALHAGVMALTIRAGAKDFYSARKISPMKVTERRIDSHHIFPRAYLKNPAIAERILNRALIDSETNRIIGKKAPSDYLDAIESLYGMEKVRDVLSSHAIRLAEDSGILNDDYEAFLLDRLEGVIQLIEDATGASVQRDLTLSKGT
jgi:hypothetical protein